MNIIYGLRDPRNDVYQYIGKSTVGNRRALQHLTKSHSDKVNEWVGFLESNWLYPLVDIIEEVEDINDLSKREEYWINYYYDINPELLNVMLIDKSINYIRTDEDEKEFDFLLSILSKLPSILKKERLYRKLSQDELAKVMNASRSTVSLCENSKDVKFSTIQKYLLTLKGLDILTKSSGKAVSKNRYQRSTA